jgi:tRNA A37 methylthiotransferase MiaB
MRTLYLHQSVDGCIESFLDFARSGRALEAGGWQLGGRPEEADLVLVNTCIVGETVERRSVEAIQLVRRKMKPGAQLVVTGCMPAYNMEKLEELGVDFAFGARELKKLLDRYGLESPPEVHALEREYMGPYNVFNWASLLLARGSRLGLPVPSYLYRRLGCIEVPDMFFLRINRGCLQSCSYCATKFATGRLASVPLEELLASFDQALAQGHRNIALCGEETGCYGIDIGQDFTVLLEALLRRKERFVLHIRQHHPHYILKRLDRYCSLLADRRVRSLTIPLQSGADRLLELMKRRHTNEQAVNLVRSVHAAAPHLLLRTHLIVGFPTETEEDFRATCRLAMDLPWDMILAYPYTNRPRTKAAELEPKVSQLTIYRRMTRIWAGIFKKVYFNDFNPLPFVRKDPFSLDI